MDPRASEAPDSASAEPVIPTTPNTDQKYCSECGKIVLRRAEICPGCGCRVSGTPPPPIGAVPPSWNVREAPQLQSQFVLQMAILLVLNCFWAGLGNLAVGDQRGWSFGFATWLAIGLSFLIPVLPLLAWFAFASYLGYQFIQEREAVLRAEV